MRIKCRFNDLAELDALAVTRLAPFINRSGPDYDLELGAEYFVYGIELMRGGIWIYIEISGRDYPFPYPIEFFEVMDSSIPSNWIVAAPYRGMSKAIISFEEWATKPDFYENLVNDSPTEVSIYESQKGKSLE